MAGDAAYVASFLAQRTTSPVVLVGRSYGGVVITNAGAAGDNAKALVYVDAFIPEVGESTFQILGGSGSAFDVPDPKAVFDIVGYPGAPEGDAEAFLKPSAVHDAFAQDLPEADRWLIVASQRPITLGANTAPTQTASWKTIPSWAVIGTEDRVIPPATQRSMAGRAMFAPKLNPTTTSQPRSAAHCAVRRARFSMLRSLGAGVPPIPGTVTATIRTPASAGSAISSSYCTAVHIPPGSSSTACSASPGPLSRRSHSVHSPLMTAAPPFLSLPDNFADIDADECRWRIGHIAELAEGRLRCPGVFLSVE